MSRRGACRLWCILPWSWMAAALPAFLCEAGSAVSVCGWLALLFLRGFAPSLEVRLWALCGCGVACRVAAGDPRGGALLENGVDNVDSVDGGALCLRRTRDFESGPTWGAAPCPRDFFCVVRASTLAGRSPLSAVSEFSESTVVRSAFGVRVKVRSERGRTPAAEHEPHRGPLSVPPWCGRNPPLGRTGDSGRAIRASRIARPRLEARALRLSPGVLEGGAGETVLQEGAPALDSGGLAPESVDLVTRRARAL
jgi:hypothetical protein